VEEKIFDQQFFMTLVDKILRERGISQERFCREALGRKDGTTYNGFFVRGAKPRREIISIEKLIKICRYLNISIDWALRPGAVPEHIHTEDKAARFKVISTTIPELPAIRSAPEKLDTMRLSFVPRKGFKRVAMIENLAAGHNDDSYEIVADAFVESAPSDCCVARVLGDSMLPTLQSGAYILLKNMPNGGYELPQIEAPDEKTNFREWKGSTGIRDGGICVLSVALNSGPSYGPTLKRILYDTSRGEANWTMVIGADNPAAWRRDIAIRKGDHVKVFSMFMALLETES
jgi:hypothetical protein